MDVHEYSPYGDSWKRYGYRENNDEEIGANTNIKCFRRGQNIIKKKDICHLSKVLK